MYINEVKRDKETLKKIREFQSSIENLVSAAALQWGQAWLALGTEGTHTPTQAAASGVDVQLLLLRTLVPFSQPKCPMP